MNESRMFLRSKVLVQSLAILIILPCLCDCLIITSVIAGDKKFKTISFDSKFLKPLMFESELPNTEFRRHRTLRPPKFDIDVNIPIKLPVEDEYAPPEYKKPVVSDIAFETGEIVDKYYKKSPKRYQQHSPATNNIQFKESLEHAASNQANKMVQVKFAPQIITESSKSAGRPGEVAQRRLESPVVQSNIVTSGQMKPHPPARTIRSHQDRSNAINGSNNNNNLQRRNSYQAPYQPKQSYHQPEFVPGGFVNLQLSGPTGGPKMTYEDFDREKWAQQLSQTSGAMPYPILNYQQLQNFYGGLGTFTNGLAENRYTYVGPLEKLKRMFTFKG